MNQRKLSVKHLSTENNPKFKFIWLGQTILKYQVPLDIFNTINGIYKNNFKDMPDAHKQLVGKIGKENSLFFNGADNKKCTSIICFLPMFLTGLKVSLNTT